MALAPSERSCSVTEFFSGGTRVGVHSGFPAFAVGVLAGGRCPSADGIVTLAMAQAIRKVRVNRDRGKGYLLAPGFSMNRTI
jgi:hypothetical protein